MGKRNLNLTPSNKRISTFHMALGALLVVLAAVLISQSAAWVPQVFGGILHSKWKEAKANLYSMWKRSTYIEPQCFYAASDPVRKSALANSVKNSLQRNIAGQQEGVEVLLDCLRAWEYGRGETSRSLPEPLVIAITGPTGVGKTEAAYRVAEAMLTRRYSVGDAATGGGGGGRLQSRRGGVDGDELTLGIEQGLLVVRGSMLSNTSLIVTRATQGGDTEGGAEPAVGAAGIAEARSFLRQSIFSLLHSCSRGSAAPVGGVGSAGVVFIDEAQMIVPGVLDELIPMLSARGVVTGVPEDGDGAAKGSSAGPGGVGATSAGSCDAAADEACGDTEPDTAEPPPDGRPTPMSKYISYPTNNLVFILVSDIGAAEMNHVILQYGDRENVPLRALRGVVKQALDKQWERLKFGRMLNEVVPFLPLEPKHIEQVLRLKIEDFSNNFRRSRWVKLCIDDEVVSHLANLLTYKRYVMSGPSSASQAAQDATSPPPTPTSKLFAEYGAREIERVGPLQDLKMLLYKHMEPWRPDQVLHVGLASVDDIQRRTQPSAVAKQRRSRGTPPEAHSQIYLQWCYVHGRMFREEEEEPAAPSDAAGVGASSRRGDASDDNALLDSIEVGPSVAFSSVCETIWYGRVDAALGEK